ncbi:MAG: phosphoribosyltransferase [Acidobacteriota bacterium]
MPFKDRFDAGERLAERLQAYKNKDAVVLAIPRGGLEIGYPIAKTLGIPMDVALTKKIGHPANSEYAIGAVSLSGRVVDPGVQVSGDYIEGETERLRKSLQNRYREYRDDRKPEALEGRVAIIVDDGLATGHTMRATIDLVRESRPDKIVVAVPVAPLEAIQSLREKVDEVVCLETPLFFRAIGQFYQHFEQVSDETARSLLETANV